MLGVALLIFLNGLYVAAEFALVAVDRSKIEQLAEDGHRGAGRTLAALKSLSFQLSGAQLGITITSLLVGFLLEPTLGQVFRPVLEAIGLPETASVGASLAIALGVASACQMVFGELVPKNLAIARPEAVAFKLVAPIRWSNLVFKPLIMFLNAAANWAVRRLGIEPRDELETTYSLEEIDVLIQSSREGGLLREEEFSLMTRSISFIEKTAEDAMKPRTSTITLSRDDTLETMAEVSTETGYSRFPVVGDGVDDVIGIAHVKDSFKIPLEERADTAITAISRDALIAPESRDLRSLLRDMRRERKQMAVVVDEYGGTAGIVTIEDILEEIVGEIEDEHDLHAVTRAEPGSGVHVVTGMLHRDEMAEQTGFHMPEGEFETLAGFLLSLFDRLPEPGDHAAYEKWEFKVVEMDRNRIARVLVVAPRSGPIDHEGDR
ncbi:MAG: hemolysin family protein [Actinomycetota bacterium]